MGTAVGAAIALCACDDVFGLERHVDAAIDTPWDSQLGGPDAPPDAAIDAMIDAPVGAVCPATFGPVMGQGSYRYLTQIMDWPAAQAMCASFQIVGSTLYTHLAVIDQDPERSHLNATQPTPTWIGASDRVLEGRYLWLTNQASPLPPSGSPWATGEPGNTDVDDCVEMGQTADYLESSCSLLRTVWCECDAFPIVPANF